MIDNQAIRHIVFIDIKDVKTAIYKTNIFIFYIIYDNNLLL